MSDSVQSHRWQPTRLLCLWDSPSKNTAVGCHFLLQCMKVKSESEFTQSCPTLATPWTAAYQTPPFLGFSRQEYWSGVPLPSPKIFLYYFSNQLHLTNPDIHPFFFSNQKHIIINLLLSLFIKISPSNSSIDSINACPLA